MPTTCAVFGYHNRQTKKIIRSFYRFPKEQDRRRRWLAFIGRKNQDGSFWEPGTGDRVYSDHFISKMKSDVPNDMDYVPSVQVVQDLGRNQTKPSRDQTNYSWANNNAVACFERIKRRHSMQQANKRDRSLQADELHRNLQIVNHDHTYVLF